MEANEIIKKAREYLNAQNLIIMLCVGAFLPYVFSVITCVIAFLVIITSPNLQKGLFNFKGSMLMFVFLAYSMAVAFLNRNALGMLVAPVFFCVFVVFCFVRQNIKKETFDTCLTAVCFTVFPAFLTAVLEILLQSGNNELIYRYASFYGNANWFGSLTAAIVIICAYKIVSAGGRAWFYYAVAIVGAMNIYLSGSLFAIIEVIVGVAIYLLLSKHYRLFCLMVICGSLGVILITTIPELLPRLSESSMTTGYRVRIWGIAIREIANRPFFGRGFMAYSEIQALYEGSYSTVHGHNLIIDCLINFGIVGTAILTALLYFMFRRVVAVLCSDRDSVVAILIVSFAAAVFAHSFTDITFFWIQTGVFYMVMLGGIGCEERRLGLDGDMLIKGRYRI